MRVFKNLFGDGSKISASEVIIKRGSDILSIENILDETAISVDGKDMNDITSTGFYRGYNMKNAARQNISAFIVIRYTHHWIMQMQFVMLATATTEIFVRQFYNGTTWSNWQKVF